jgi:hypothetical protein
MAEWLKAAVLKTVRGVTPSWVRILLPPPYTIDISLFIKRLHKHRDRHPTFYPTLLGRYQQ